MVNAMKLYGFFELIGFLLFVLVLFGILGLFYQGG